MKKFYPPYLQERVAHQRGQALFCAALVCSVHDCETCLSKVSMRKEGGGEVLRNVQLKLLNIFPIGPPHPPCF